MSLVKETKKKPCPECKGKGTIPGRCVCDNEWRGSMVGEEWKDCSCAREETCPICNGKGFVE
jgi:hypothetical protein